MRRNKQIKARMDGFKSGAAEGTKSRSGWMDPYSTRLKEDRRCGDTRSEGKREGEGRAGFCLLRHHRNPEGY